MKLNKLLQVRKTLSKHANETIPTMLAYKIMKFIKATDTESAFYERRLSELIDEYGLKDDNGNIVRSDEGVTIKPGSIEECTQAINELGDTEVESPNIKFTIGELTPIEFSVAELYILEEIITEER